MVGVIVQIVGGLAVLAPCVMICRAYAKHTEAMAELIEALDRYAQGTGRTIRHRRSEAG